MEHTHARHLSVVGAPDPAESDLLLGQDVDTGADVWLPDEVRLRGVTVIGKTGTGKSRLLERLVLDDLRRDIPAVVIDPHGRLVNRVLALAPADARERLILLEPWPESPWRLNLLDCPDPASDTALDRTVDQTVEVFKKLFDRAEEYQPRMERDLDAAVRTVLPNRGTLLDVLRLFTDDGLRERYQAAVADAAVAEYWDYFDRLGREAERARQVEATVNRLYRLLAPRLIRRIVDTTATTVPFDEVLAGNRLLLLSVPAGELTGKRCDFVGALFLAALTDRIFARQAALANPPRLHLYLDEYARFATPMTAELFAEGRKYGVGLTVAHQTLAQIPDAANRAAERQVGALVLFQLIGPDAEELAGELDTTPVRTKTVMRQRTEPQYEEWDEPVWDPPEAEHAHAAAEARLASLTYSRKVLARRRLGYLYLEYAAYGRAGAFDALLAGTLPACQAHLPFNPHLGTIPGSSLDADRYALPRYGHTVGGLHTVGPPDFWDPKCPGELRYLPCEGYVLDIDNGMNHGYGGGGPLRGHLLSRLAQDLGHMKAYSSLYRPFLGKGEAFRKYLPEGMMLVYPELLILTDDERKHLLWELQRQVSTMLEEQYREAVFWFSPYKYRATINQRNREFHQAPNKWDKSEFKVRNACLQWKHEWLMSTRPELGQERPLRTVDWAAKKTPDGQWVAEKSEFANCFDPWQWPSMGCWQLTAFPQAVAWLKDWIHEAKRDIAALEAEYYPPPGRQAWGGVGMAKRESDLKERIATLENAHHKQVHHKVCRGDLPVKRRRSDPINVRPWRGRYPPPDPPVIEDQWYDTVEELDQTHADRRLELANELTQLAPFTAYCRTSAGQHHVALPQTAETALDEERIERIRRASKARYGRPPQPPEPPAAPRAPNAAPKPPAGPRPPISRHPLEGPEL